MEDPPPEELREEIEYEPLQMATPEQEEKVYAKERPQKNPSRILQPETFEEKMALQFKRYALYLLEMGDYDEAK